MNQTFFFIEVIWVSPRCHASSKLWSSEKLAGGVEAMQGLHHALRMVSMSDSEAVTKLYPVGLAVGADPWV